MLCSGLIKYSTVTSVAAAAANLNVIERKFKRQILKPDPIILGGLANLR